MEVFAIPDRTATTIAMKLIQGVMCRHGAPERIISDRDSAFISDVFRETTEMLNIKQSMTTAYNPQADGQAEKAIGTLHNTLSKMVNSNQTNWDTLIPYALWGHRTAVHATTKETPYFLIYGRDPVNPVDNRIRQWVETHPKIEEFTENTVNRLLEARDRVIKTTANKKEKMKENWDKNRKDNPFKRGDLVWLKNMKKTPTENTKLKAKFEGPYIITEIVTGEHDLNVSIQHTNNVNDKQRVSIRRLKPAHVRPKLIQEYLKMLPSEEENTTKEPYTNLQAAKVDEKTVSNTKPIRNKKGRNIFTQERREKQTKRAKDTKTEWEVEAILDVRNNRKTSEKSYLVKWLGYNTPSWVKDKDINAGALVKEFHAKAKLVIKSGNNKRK